MARIKNILGGIVINFVYVYLFSTCSEASLAHNSRAEFSEECCSVVKDDHDDYIRGDNELDQMNGELLELNKINAQLEWESAIKPFPNISDAKIKFYRLKTLWKMRWCDKLTTHQQRGNVITFNKNQSRMIYLLCHRGPKYSLDEIKRLSSISDRILFNYNMKKICRIHFDNHTLVADEERKEICYRGEHDVKRLMQISRDEPERRWAWSSWRKDMVEIKNLFTESIAIQNSGARRNGYTDVGACWREEMDITNVEHSSNNLWQSIKPLYKLLHAVVRFRLRKQYPQAIAKATAPIPAHLIGDLWSMDWQSLTDVLFPKYYFNITNILVKKNYTVNKMIKDSEDFFTSLQFPPMTNKFWKMSKITRRNNSFFNCHGSAANMYQQNDFRISACFEVNEENLRIIQHEMGHVQYYMAYKNQPVIYQNGVSSAFHESIGDSIFLGFMTPQHLHRLGFISNIKDDELSTKHLALLLKQALTNIPQIPYALLMDKWRWRVFEGVVDEDKYNKAWWDLHKSMMGIVPPNSRRDSAQFFDAAKLHIISNTPYIRYFFGIFLQFQIFESMCRIAVISKKKSDHNKFDFPLHECDIYGAQAAGSELRKLMTMGSSIDTHGAFLHFFNTTGFCADSLLKYFKPIEKFLERQIQLDNIPVGWY